MVNGISGLTSGSGDSINLRKNATLNLTKRNKHLKNVLVGLGWEIGDNNETYDLDASAYLLNSRGQCPDASYAIIYVEGHDKNYGLTYGGDNKTGGSKDDDDETIEVDLRAVPAHIETIKFVISIYDAIALKQNFGQVKNAYVRIVDKDTGKEECKYSLSDEYGSFQCVIVGELYREGEDWSFRALGEGIVGELDKVLPRFGLRAQ